MKYRLLTGQEGRDSVLNRSHAVKKNNTVAQGLTPAHFIVHVHYELCWNQEHTDQKCGNGWMCKAWKTLCSTHPVLVQRMVTTWLSATYGALDLIYLLHINTSVKKHSAKHRRIYTSWKLDTGIFCENFYRVMSISSKPSSSSNIIWDLHMNAFIYCRRKISAKLLWII